MSQHRRNLLRSSAGVAFATLMSRILGLLRVLLEAMVLGGGAFASAWQLAFMVPNLFRRLLGEGALGTALIPLLIHIEEEEGVEQVRKDMTMIFALLAGILALLVVIVSGGAYLVRPMVESDYARIAWGLMPLLMPYALFICFIGVIGSILNSRHVFFLPALGALLLNLFLIAGLAAGALHNVSPANPDSMIRFLEGLSGLVVLSGVIQLLLLVLLLRWKGITPRLTREAFRGRKEVLVRLWRMVLPGMIGAGALQLSFLADRTIAAWLGPQAVPALTYTDRLIDLPIGIFAVTLSSVLMPALSRSAAQKDWGGFAEDLTFGLRTVYFIGMPAAVFLLFFWRPVAQLLFLRGNFLANDLEAMSAVMMIYGAGIPLFCSLKVLLPAFHSRQEMKTPLYVSMGCIALNILLNLLLMNPLRQGGIALATVISSFLQNAILYYLLRRRGIAPDWKPVAKTLLRAAVSAVAAAIGASLLATLAASLAGTRNDLLITPVLCIAFGILYLGLYFLSGGREATEFLTILRNRRNRTT